MKIETISTESLGNRGYLIDDGANAIAIDVQRDYGHWIEAAKTAGVQITHIFETHMHNDYVTGGYQMALELGATYVVPAHSDASFECTELADNETIQTGDLKITGFHTPGHTEHHMSYKVADAKDSAIFTGGGILYGTVGRTDLVAKDLTKRLTYAQYDSAQRLGEELDDSTAVFPTHGFGSFCSSAAGSGVAKSNMAAEKRSNVAFTTSRDAFVRQIISSLGPYPKYYAHMGSMNQAGPSPIDRLHRHDYSVDILASWLRQDNAWVIDVRSRKLFASNHPEGSIGIELGNSFATYTGWIIPWEEKLILVGDSAEELQSAYIELTRIGMEQFIDGATSNMKIYLAAATKSSYSIKTFTDLKNMTVMPYVLDVRLASDWSESHVKNSTNIPLHELLDRLNEIPNDLDIWAHCASGYRASIAASLLDKFAKHPILINDDFSNATKNGLTDN